MGFSNGKEKESSQAEGPRGSLVFFMGTDISTSTWSPYKCIVLRMNRANSFVLLSSPIHYVNGWLHFVNFKKPKFIIHCCY